MQVSKVSFGGIYDINFPKNTEDSKVRKICNNLNIYANKHGFSNYVAIVDYKNLVNSNNHKKGFRLISTVDNPLMLVKLFGQISEELAEQYIEKTKINLTV